MFDKDRYITNGINSSVPLWLQQFMWRSIDTMTVASKDYLQVFKASCSYSDNVVIQKIVHSQEQPLYKHEYLFPVQVEPLNAKIFVIDDGSHSTMLLSEEY